MKQVQGYKLESRKIDHVNKKEVFFYKKGIGQYLTITISRGQKLELIKEYSSTK